MLSDAEGDSTPFFLLPDEIKNMDSETPLINEAGFFPLGAAEHRSQFRVSEGMSE